MVAPLTWGRRLVGEIKAKSSTEGRTPIGTLRVSDQPWSPGLSLTYVGHTVMRAMALPKSHLFIDRGAYACIPEPELLEIGRSSLRERVCQYVYVTVGAQP